MFENIKAIKRFDPAAKSYLEIVLCYPGLHALWLHKIAHFLYWIHVPLFPRLINYFARFLTGVDIHPGAKIANGVFIDHGSGVVIGETAIIGKGCLLFQGVTLGGTGKETGKRHPTLEENVVVGAGAKVLGNITIGENVRIGAGSVVMKNVPSGSTVVGIPGKIVKFETASEKNSSQMLDHNQLPDPIAKVFSIVLERLDAQEETIKLLQNSQKHFEDKTPTNVDLAKEKERIILEFIDGDGI